MDRVNHGMYGLFELALENCPRLTLDNPPDLESSGYLLKVLANELVHSGVADIDRMVEENDLSVVAYESQTRDQDKFKSLLMLRVVSRAALVRMENGNFEFWEIQEVVELLQVIRSLLLKCKEVFKSLGEDTIGGLESPNGSAQMNTPIRVTG